MIVHTTVGSETLDRRIKQGMWEGEEGEGGRGEEEEEKVEEVEGGERHTHTPSSLTSSQQWRKGARGGGRKGARRGGSEGGRGGIREGGGERRGGGEGDTHTPPSPPHSSGQPFIPIAYLGKHGFACAWWSIH